MLDKEKLLELNLEDLIEYINKNSSEQRLNINLIKELNIDKEKIIEAFIKEKEDEEKQKTILLEKKKLKRKKIKRYIIILIVVIALILSSYFLYNRFVVGKNNYENGLKLYDDKKFKDALEQLDNVHGYKNTSQLIKKIKYDWAKKLIKDTEYDGAIVLLKQIDGYQDVTKLLSEVKKIKKETEKVKIIYNYDASKQYENCIAISAAVNFVIIPRSDAKSSISILLNIENYYDKDIVINTSTSYIYVAGINIPLYYFNNNSDELFISKKSNYNHSLNLATSYPEDLVFPNDERENYGPHITHTIKKDKILYLQGSDIKLVTVDDKIEYEYYRTLTIDSYTEFEEENDYYIHNSFEYAIDELNVKYNFISKFD